MHAKTRNGRDSSGGSNQVTDSSTGSSIFTAFSHIFYPQSLSACAFFSLLFVMNSRPLDSWGIVFLLLAQRLPPSEKVQKV